MQKCRIALRGRPPLARAFKMVGTQAQRALRHRAEESVDVECSGRTRWSSRVPDPCDVISSIAISATRNPEHRRNSIAILPGQLHRGGIRSRTALESWVQRHWWAPVRAVAKETIQSCRRYPVRERTPGRLDAMRVPIQRD